MSNEDWFVKLHHDIWKILLFSACSRKDCCNFCILGSLGNEAFPVKIGCCNREICNSLWCVKFLRVPNSNFLFDTWTWIIITNSDWNTYQCLYLCLPFRKTVNRSKNASNPLRSLNRHSKLTLRYPLRKKLRMSWFFDVSKVKESSFFLIGPHWPPQIFDPHLLENTNFSPSSVQFSVGFYIKIMFWVRWFYSLFERMRLKRKNDVYSQ